MDSDLLVSYVGPCVHRRILAEGGAPDFQLCLPPRSQGSVVDFAGYVLELAPFVDDRMEGAPC